MFTLRTQWFKADMTLGRVGIFDGTNTTVTRRQWILDCVQDILPSTQYTNHHRTNM